MDAVLFVLLFGLVLVGFVHFIKEGVIMFSFTKWIRGIQGKIAANYWNWVVSTAPEPVVYIADDFPEAVLEPVPYIDTDFKTEHNTIFPPYVPEPTHFTQAEKQFLQVLLKDGINELEDFRKGILSTAKAKQEMGYAAYPKQLFKIHRQVKAKMKKLVSIQKKVKSTLETRG